MKKYKTVLPNSFSLSQITDIDTEIQAMQKQQKNNDKYTLNKKYQLIQKELELQKHSKKILEKQLAAYRKVVLKNGDLSELLQMQQQKIFELTTNMEILQNKYEKILKNNGSSSQTEYAIKCKQLEKILSNKQVQHQQQMSTLKNKMMKMTANEIVERGREIDGPIIRTNSSLGPNIMTPLKNSRKLV